MFFKNKRNKVKEKDTTKQVEKFNNAIDFANRLLEKSKKPNLYSNEKTNNENNPLLDLVRLLGKNLQAKYLTHLVYLKYESDLASIRSWDILFDNGLSLNENGETFCDILCRNRVNTKRDVYLSKDLVLPSPWSTERYVNTITNIGKGRVSEEWREDNNHRVSVWLPMGIVWVESGNHSISSGIIQGDGIIKNGQVYDISEVYKYVKCDGVNYIRIEDNSILDEVRDLEFAIIFEIGRLMANNGISF